MTRRLPKRPKAHVLETRSRQHVEKMFPPEWICRRIEPDYGLDLRVEIADDETVTGLEFCIQLKSTERLRTSRGDVIHRCKVSTAQYFLRRIEPVMYIVYDARRDVAYWVWVQPYLRQMEETDPNWSSRRTVPIRIPLANKLIPESIPGIHAGLEAWWEELAPFTRQYLSRRELEETAHVFICHQPGIAPDHGLAGYLKEFLTAQGHIVHMGATLRAGPGWLQDIDQYIETSDILVVLLSWQSADSEMVQAEIKRAYEYQKTQGHPHTLPVRVAHKGLLPYSISFFLDPSLYVDWQNGDDSERVGIEILAAIEGWLEKRKPIGIDAKTQITLSEDGRQVVDTDALHSPLPRFDPRVLVDPEVPRGVVRLQSRFYIKRHGDSILRREVVKPGSLTYIRAARQTGKSSLLLRGISHARQHGLPVVFVDCQFIATEYLADQSSFLRSMAELIAASLGINEVEKVWRSSKTATAKMNNFLERSVLEPAKSPLLLAIDEADRAYGAAFQDDFFSMVRAWYNLAQWHEIWSKLIVAMVISTEPHLLIGDIFRSPFNVGTKIELEDFSESQVADLNQRHGGLVSSAQIHDMTEYLGGHPYLTRKALYVMLTDGLTWEEIVNKSIDEQGPFGDHLRHYLWLLHGRPELTSAMKQIMKGQSCGDDTIRHRLQAAGLIRCRDSQFVCRCRLYQHFFEKVLQ